MLGPFNVDRIRLLLQKGQSPSDQLTGSAPVIYIGADMQLEIAYSFLGSLIDGSYLTSITAAIKSSSGIDGAAVIANTVVPASSGWNSNPALNVGNQIIPSYATYSGGGSYTIGVQQGGIYTWNSGANDLTLTNGATLVTGSNIVTSASTGGGSYSVGGTATLTGLTVGSFYSFSLGANDTKVNNITSAGPLFFLASSTSVTLTGTASQPITSVVRPATIGSNIVSGSAVYVSGAVVATGSNIVPSGQSYSSAVSGQAYGTYTLTGLTPGSTYAYSFGNSEPTGVGSIAGNSTTTGYFTASTSSVLITGVASASVTIAVYATTTTGSFTVSGLTQGSTYYWTKGANDSTCGSLSNSGFFTATSTQVVLTGTPSTLITANLQQVSSTGSGTFTASATYVILTGTASASVTATLTGNVGWAASTDQHAVIPFSHTQTSLLSASAGSTQAYWLLISAQFSNGDTEVLCAGTINATDTGVTNGSVSGNLVPNGATYNGSGNYTLTGLTNGSYYYWGKGANDSTCGSLSSNGNFIESGTTIVLTGTPSAAVTAIVQQVSVPSNVSGIYPIPNGQNYLVVTGLSIPFTPRGIQCTVMSGSGDGSIGQPQVVQSTISSTGFTVNFQGSTTSSNYYLIWTAIQ